MKTRKSIKASLPGNPVKAPSDCNRSMVNPPFLFIFTYYNMFQFSILCISAHLPVLSPWKESNEVSPNPLKKAYLLAQVTGLETDYKKAKPPGQLYPGVLLFSCS